MTRLALLALAWLLASVPAPAQERELMYVANSRADYVSVIDVSTHTEVGRVPGVKHPSGLIVSRDGRRLYVAAEGEPALMAFDTTSHRLLWKVRVDPMPHHVAVSGDGRLVYVCIFSGDHLQIVDTDKQAVVGSVEVGLGPHNVLASPDGKRIYAGMIHHDRVAVVDVATQKMTRAYPLGERVRPIAITNDEKTLYSQLSRLQGFVAVDLASGDITRRIDLPPLKERAPIAFPYNVNHGLALTPDNTQIWANASLDGYVSVYSVPDYKLLGTMPTGRDPNWIEFSRDGRFAFITSRGTNSVRVFRVADRTQVASIAVGEGPQRIVRGIVPGPVTFTSRTQP
jgi:YVTN family beta-propeller protein